MREEIRGSPQQLDLGSFHFGQRAVYEPIEIRVALRQGIAFGREVAIVKTEEGCAELLEKLEGASPRFPY